MARPSLLREGEDTIYIPLNKLGTDEIMMVEMRNLSHDKSRNLFMTKEEAPILIILKEIVTRENFSDLITITRK